MNVAFLLQNLNFCCVFCPKNLHGFDFVRTFAALGIYLLTQRVKMKKYILPLLLLFAANAFGQSHVVTVTTYQAKASQCDEDPPYNG